MSVKDALIEMVWPFRKPKGPYSKGGRVMAYIFWGVLVLFLFTIGWQVFTGCSWLQQLVGVKWFGGDC
jgi:hypothetical protein